MTTASLLRPAALALVLAAASPAGARDVYRGFLDPANPQHRATLEILARLEKTPNDAGLHNDLGCLIARDGFWRDALREFDTSAKLDTSDGRPYYNAGLVETTRGKWGAARTAFKKAVGRTPGNWAGWWMLGFAEERLGNTSAAVSAYSTSLRVDTSLFDVKRNPYAAQTRLKARVLLETYDRRIARVALPVTEQVADSRLLTAFQADHVSVVAAPGPVVVEDAEPLARPRTAPGPGGGPASAGPGTVLQGGGAVVTSVPPVSSSRPAPAAAPVTTAPDSAPSRSGGLEEAPPWFPQTSPAGPAPPKPAPRPETDPGAPKPTPAPPSPGPGIG